jgi:hypothetical protein
VAEEEEVVVALPAEVTVVVPAAFEPAVEREPGPRAASSAAVSTAEVQAYSGRNLHRLCEPLGDVSSQTIRG